MKKIYLILLAIVFINASSLFAQNAFFSDAGENAKRSTTGTQKIFPQKYRGFSMNVVAAKNFMWSLPSESTVKNRNAAPIMEIPMPDGHMEKFRVWESSIMEPGLAAKFPEMRTFSGQGIDDPFATIRFDYNPYTGFHAQILSAVTGRVYIDPYANGDLTYYMSYYTKDYTRDVKFICEVVDVDIKKGNSSNIINAVCLGTSLRTYRLALACTGEYSVAVASPQPPSIPLSAAAMLVSVNRVTGVYEKEVSLKMTLIANNDLLIYLNGATDPYSNTNGSAMLGENQANIDAVIGTANYDIGHVFSTGGGGVAGLGVVCVTGNKARGVTGSPNPVGDGFDIDYVAHEIGHQFAANHPMAAGCGSSPISTKFEVGSGTTIMAYAGICGGENIQPNSDPTFHAISFDEISNFISSGSGSTCGVPTPTGNTLPVIDPLPNNNLSIPPGTPFTLTGTATDANNDPLTYCWEQWDLQGTQTWNAGATAPINNTVPLFKSRVPKTTGERTFPDMAVILAGFPANPPSAMGGLKGETLSPVARAMKFRLTVRDNRAGGGGVVSLGSGGCISATNFQINVVGTTPFTVTSPNGGESYSGGSTQTITWNPAGTAAAPYNVTNVRISLSTDGGLTYPTVITASTPNDGTEALTIPSMTTTTARIKIEAVGNIFFDISNANFIITAASNPTFTFVTPTNATVTCGTSAANITLNTTSVLSFATPIILTSSGNPGGTSISYSVNPVIPGNSTVVTLNNMGSLAPGSYPVTITGTAGAEVKTIILTYVVSAGSGPTITAQPSIQTLCAGGNTSFSITSPTATAYQWQLSTNGGAVWNNITNGGVYSNATTSTLNLTGVTAVMNTYQYRCIASIVCGSTNSNAAVLNVNSAPAVTGQPANMLACVGNSISFTVTATGAGLTYQWQESIDGGTIYNNVLNAAPYSNVTAATLTINPTTIGMSNYRYRCIVTGSCTPAITSNAGTLTVGTPISISAQPLSSTICAGMNTSFSVTASGTITSYQWQISINGGSTWNNISNGGVYTGATTTTLNLTGVTVGMDTYQYRCVVNGNCPSVNSNTAILTVNSLPAISAQPSNSTICAAQNTTFNITASGTGVTYQWQVSTAGCAGPWTNLVNGAPYAGVTTASLSLTGTNPALNGYGYRCVVSGTCTPAVNSNCVLLTVNTPISIISQPSMSTVCAGAQTTFTIGVTGTSPTYLWQESTNGGGSWSNVINGGVYSGATTSILTLTGVTAGMSTYQYRVNVTGAAPCAVASSNSGTLTLNTAPAITAQPVAATTICSGSNTSFSVTANGTALTYQWQISTTGCTGTWTNLTNTATYSGVTSATLSITAGLSALNGSGYRCVISGTCTPAVNSTCAFLTVNTPINISTQPAAITNICATGSTSFTTVATGTLPTYQWQLSTTGAAGPWTNITNTGVYTGATTNMLTLSNIIAGMNGYMYRNVVTGTAPCGVVNTNNALLNVTPQPVITASATSLLAGHQATLTVNVTPAPGLSFAWYLNGTLLPGLTSNSIIATVNSLGNYRVVVTSATGSCQSELVAISATPSANLFVYPSPNDGRFTVSYYTAGASSTNMTKQNITIYSTEGKTVFNREFQVSQPYQLHAIDLRKYSAGLYYIILREANGNTIKTGEVFVR